MCVAYIFTKLWTGKFFGLLARSSYSHGDTGDVCPHASNWEENPAVSGEHPQPNTPGGESGPFMLLLESKGGGWERKTVRAAGHHPAREHQILGTEMILRGVNVNIILTVPPLRVSALV